MTSGGNKRVSVLWDCSQSCAPEKERTLSFFTELEKDYEMKNTKVKFDVTAFSTTLFPLGQNLTATGVVEKLLEVVYDGGTNLAVLGTKFLEQLQNKAYDYFVLFTDGVDNIGDSTRLPEGISEDLDIPIHVITPDSKVGATVNDNLLRCITSQTGGTFNKLSEYAAHLISGSTEDFVITHVEPVVDGQSEQTILFDLFMDDDFATVPDFRLPDKSWWPLREDGALISGTLPVSTKVTPTAFDITFLSSNRGKLVTRIPFGSPSGGSPFMKAKLVASLVPSTVST
eukprot:TRINITY_DN7249_c0_g2_i5.p1 TRINITY_DN7249_c0_g2~~TRINITY_DN7249_c0_g2_i5.p1  ORF type:complete len:285 (-),score=27.01 TRINITY_DN7249_c0_g2_i5:348-1202(-)